MVSRSKTAAAGSRVCANEQIRHANAVPANYFEGPNLMANPAPVLTLDGTCHSVQRRHVPALEAQPEQRDEQGNFLRRAREARAAYDTTDVLVLTNDGGFATVVLSDDALAELGGELPEPGKPVSYAVRTYIKWERQGERSWTVVGLSVAGDVTARRNSVGKRSHVSAAS